MILTCPQCAARYTVDGASLGAGRTVRCAACGNSWRAGGDAPLELSPAPAEAAPFGRGPASTPDPARGPLAGADLPRSYRAKVEDRRKVKQAATQGAVWTAAIVAGLLVLAALILFRGGVVRAVPGTAALYAAVGLPVNPVGLTIEKIAAQPALQGGQAALAVSGVIRNVKGKPVSAPPLRVSLLDDKGKTIRSEVLAPAAAPLAAGAERKFAASLLNPPARAENVEVTFILGRKAKVKPVRTRALKARAPDARRDLGLRSAAAREAPTPAPAPVQTPGPVPAGMTGGAVEAAPLEADSPYALPATAESPDG